MIFSKKLVFAFLLLFSNLLSASPTPPVLDLFPYVGLETSMRSTDFPPDRGKHLFYHPNFSAGVIAGFNFNRCLGVEASYHKTSHTKIDHLVFHVLGSFPLEDLINKLYAGVGFAAIKPYDVALASYMVAPSITAGWYHELGENVALRMHVDSKFLGAFRSRNIVKSVGAGASLIYNF